MKQQPKKDEEAPEEKVIQIGERIVGANYPVLVVAEISCNHLQNFKRAKELVKIACECGVGAIKVQTYTPDTMTLNSKKEPFQIKVNDLWKGRTLYDLYKKACMPWDWYQKLEKIAKSYGKFIFSTPYDDSAVDFLEKMKVPVYKIASQEITDLELFKKIGKTKKPVIMSKGMSTLAELAEAISVLRQNGSTQIAILQCVSSYPAKPEEMNLATICNIGETFNVVSGLSDHSLVPSIAVASVVLGAKIIEKHFTLKRSDGGFDATFSLEPKELKELVQAVSDVEKAIGRVNYDVGSGESENRIFRRSLWVACPIKKGEIFTKENIGRFRPAHGLPVKFLSQILRRKATRDIEFATPLSWDLVGD